MSVNKVNLHCSLIHFLFFTTVDLMVSCKEICGSFCLAYMYLGSFNLGSVSALCEEGVC